MRRVIFLLLLLVSCSPASAQIPTTTPCANAAAAALSPYVPSSVADSIQIADGHFVVSGQPFVPRGVNYYPSRYPWRRFLTEADQKAVDAELAMLGAAGFNTLRIFLWNQALFDCQTPKAEAFHRLDRFIYSAAARNFRLIVTLNDLPDLDTAPLYSNPAVVVEQTRLIVERYRDERAILAWDLRNEGDIDYGANNLLGGKFRKGDVLGWLEKTSALVRSIAPYHLLTAGWLSDSVATAPYVDFLSFHHWNDAADLRRRAADLRPQTDKPILLEEFGYSTFNRSPDEQARLLREVAQAAEDTHLAGWLVWTAFDFPLDATCSPAPCVSQDNAEHHFGLWTADYQPKPALDALRALLP
jgi:endo-1,4-beta-mannosidase